MTAQPNNVFIVQTADSNRSGRTKGNQISLINKQSALYKYRQQRKRKESRTSPVTEQATPVPSLGTQRKSWLLESRVPQDTTAASSSVSNANDSCTNEDRDSNSFDFNYSHDFGTEDVDTTPPVDNTQLHDCYAGLRTDPFSSMPVEQSSVVLGVSDLYTNMLIPHVSKIAKVFGVDDCYLDLFWTMVFQEDTIDTVIAMSHCAEITVRRPMGFTPQKGLFLHRAKSLAMLQQRLTDPETMNTGTTILLLMYNCNIARSLGDIQAAKQHKGMIRHLLRNDMSLESLGYQGKLKTQLTQWEYFMTLGGEEPLFRRTEHYESIYPILPLQGDTAEIVCTLPGGFKLLAEAGRLSCQVLDVLGRVQRMMTAIKERTGQAFLTSPGEKLYPDYHAAVPCLSGSGNGKERFERLLCCTILLVTSRILCGGKVAPWCLPTTGGRTILTQEIANYPPESDVESQGLIWMWLIAIDSWAFGNERMPEQAQVLMQQLVDRYPDTADWSFASTVARDFFWNTNLETSIEAYWNLRQ